MLRIALGVGVFALPASGWAETPDQAAQAVFDSFVADFGALDPPVEPLVFSYQDNFAHVPSAEVLRQRTALWTRTRDALRPIRRSALSPDVRYQYDTLAYEVGFELRRTALEADLDPDAPIGAAGLHGVAHGRRWYRLYLENWGSEAVTPGRLRRLGLADVARVTGEIGAIRDQLGYAGRDEAFRDLLAGPQFWQTDEAAVQASLRRVRETVNAHLAADFEPADVPEVEIARWEGATKDTPPGYWGDGTFHYSFFGDRFPIRTTEWLFLHEAVPGHHYQASMPTPARAAVLDQFWAPGFSEGWGAYVEDLGQDLGCYTDPYQHLGKWEWDLVRSARVVLDVDIHARGWSRDRALAWWHAHLPLADGIAEREVDRVIRWPAQVVSYKTGEHEFLALRAYGERRLGPAFDLPRFHALVLARGSIPLAVVDEVVKDAIDAEAGSPG